MIHSRTLFTSLIFAAHMCPYAAIADSPRFDLSELTVGTYTAADEERRVALVWDYIRAEGIAQVDVWSFHGCLAHASTWMPQNLAAQNMFEQCRYEALHDRAAFEAYPTPLD